MEFTSMSSTDITRFFFVFGILFLIVGFLRLKNIPIGELRWDLKDPIYFPVASALLIVIAANIILNILKIKG